MVFTRKELDWMSNYKETISIIHVDSQIDDKLQIQSNSIEQYTSLHFFA